MSKLPPISDQILNASRLDGLRKEELVALLDEHFHKNSTTLSTNEVFKEYYDRASPSKRAPAASSAPAAGPTSDGEAKPKQKRAPKVKKETDGFVAPLLLNFPLPSHSSHEGLSSPSSSLSHSIPKLKLPSGTPRSTSQLVRTFPPSPAVITDAIDVQTRRFSASVNKALAATHVEKVFNDARASVSSIVGLESVIFLLEAFYLQRQLVPWRHALDIPPIEQVGTRTQSVFVPDFFILLTDIYWSTTLLWSLISFWLPLLASWLFNFTMRPVVRAGTTVQKPRWRCDPFTFNVTKALLAWLVYTQKVRFFGLFADDTVLTVLRSMPAGYSGVIIASSIGVLASIYDAAQRK